MHQSSLNSHKNKGHSPFFFPPIMRSSVGQCRNIRFRQLSASHVIITSDFSAYTRFFVKDLIERNVNISNELNFSDVYRTIDYIGSLEKFI